MGKMKKKLNEEFLHFNQHPNADSLASFGKSKSLEAVPTENQHLIGTLEARNSSHCGIFECFKLGGSSLELEVGEKASDHVLNPLFVNEVKEPSYDDDYWYTNVPIFDEHPSEELEGVLEDDCVFEIEDVPVFREFPNEEFGVDNEDGMLIDELLVEGYGEEGSRNLEIEDCSQDLTFKLPLVQDTQLEEHGHDLEAPLFDEELVEPMVKDCFQVLPPGLPQLQDV
ncbi:uncharacterized protein LOC131335706 [Rhododendron vialii]|uniref:uncharacterized protein LOC131335706 n=1 Tax=Rhododendron vialii TaxID=182163 RepID=UPI00265DD911|nr:uncharacterized protein LOC131335706 [Rhododendron vialii]